ncbi:GTP cyclohydrolase [Thalassospira profundimaris]|uniref:GTP cyclohydrolase-2 n=1 Tax=Thalassospira profundimaris TaxID=502049 RepID=A0A367XKM1_9PROT|nr:GTP cyclohydrolase II [Thalassospira profundimaris]RCK53979.1 GTP cyclohydrolase [Thalassospira profundimaris]
MTTSKSFSADTEISTTELISVSRAVADLRRGEMILIRSEKTAIAAIATEPLSDHGLARLRAIAVNARDIALILPRVRARALGYVDASNGFCALQPAHADQVDGTTFGIWANPLLDMVEAPSASWRQTDAGEDAAIRLAKLARLLPAIVAVPVDADRVAEFATAENLLLLEAGIINGYEDAAAGSLRQVSDARVPLENAENTRVVAFRPVDGGQEHIAIIIDEPAADEPVLVRLHSECFTGDLIGSLRCDCGPQLRGAIAEISAGGKGGIVLYLRQEGRGIGLVNKLRAYALQDRGFDTLDANEELGFDADERVYRPAAEMLRQLGYSTVRILTNNPEKLRGLENWGVRVSERVPHKFPSNGHNAFYLKTKKDRAGHLF